jgi:hypothetical protein
MIAELMASAVTFKRDTAEKLFFLWLNLVDLALTLVAVSLGLTELNPLIRHMFMAPVTLVIAKAWLPLLLAWVVPGKLLIPAIALLMVVVGWDVKELIVFLV